nr:set domain-containing protein 5 [Quercus suber]
MAENSNIQHVYFFLEDRTAHTKQGRNVAPRVDPTTTAKLWPLVDVIRDKTQYQSAPVTSHGDAAELNTSISITRELSSRSDHTIRLDTTDVKPHLISSGPSVHSHTSSTSSIDSRGSAFNPRAPAFRPRTSRSGDVTIKFTPPALYTLHGSHGKGMGLFTNQFISRGTLIISEKPLMSVTNGLHQVVRAYNALCEAQKTSYDQLCFYQPQYLDLESASRACLADAVYAHMDSTDRTSVVADQVRTMGRFAANNFATIDEDHLAIFTTIARINHSCVPNVYHFYNAYENRMTVYTSQDIAEGAELHLNYIQGASTYQVRGQRIEQLRGKYGFTCHCPACSDGCGTSDIRRTMLNDIMWGLQAYIDGGPGQPSEPYSFHPSSPEMALKQAKDALELFWTEAITNVELLKALRIASMVSLELQNLTGALEYARFEDRVTKDLVGPAAYLIHPLNHGPASVWAKHIESMMMNEYEHRSNAGALTINLNKESKKGIKQTTHHDQHRASAMDGPDGTSSEAEDARTAKAIKLQKRKMQRNKAKARRRAEAEADALPPTKSSVDARLSSSNKA